jgi:hypothetical protein
MSGSVDSLLTLAPGGQVGAGARALRLAASPSRRGRVVLLQSAPRSG